MTRPLPDTTAAEWARQRVEWARQARPPRWARQRVEWARRARPPRWAQRVEWAPLIACTYLTHSRAFTKKRLWWYVARLFCTHFVLLLIFDNVTCAKEYAIHILLIRNIFFGVARWLSKRIFCVFCLPMTRKNKIFIDARFHN